MRGLLLLAVFVTLVLVMAMSPFVGLMTWAWFSFMHPHRETWGFTNTFSFDWYIAALTVAAWTVSSERKNWPVGTTPALLLIFAIWICLTTYFAIDQDFSYNLWERTEKSLALVLFVMLMTTSMVRMHALVWVIVMSLGYFAVKGGGYVALVGGGNVYGPADSMITDNNALGVALASLIPLVIYLFRVSDRKLVKTGCAIVGISILITIVGTYSRGGFLALLAVGALMALRSRAKLSMLFIGLFSLVVMFQLVPDKWKERMATITDSKVDESVQGRFDAWGTAWNVANQRPLGGGFRFGEQQAVWDQYSGLPQGVEYHAAHNIYFQVLGEHGFFGLLIYLLIMLSAIRNTQVTMRIAKQTGSIAGLELANALQLSILCIAFGGMSLSLAYYDMFLTLYAMTFALMRIVDGSHSRVNAR